MKKLILGLSSVALSVGLLSALVASEKSYASETVSANEQVKELFKDYYNGSSYIKNSSIKFDSANFGELATYFHAGSTVLDRTTYYHGNELWMSRGTEGAGYSYYGSAENNGGVTNATAEKALETPANPKVVLTGEGKESMEDYYVTMKDLMVDSFFYGENTWTTLSEGVYKTENADIMDKFRLFTAPCFLNYEEDGDKLEHYLTLSKATVTKSGAGLVLSLYVDGTDSGKVVGEADSEGDYLLSQATVSYEADVWDGTTVSTSLKGAGTEADPYLISSGADLAYVKSVVDAATSYTETPFKSQYLKMTTNIDMGNRDFMIGYHSAWNKYDGFAGVFDGNNYSIRGLNTTPIDGSSALFGCIMKTTGELKNLSVYGNVSGASTVGGAVAYLLGKATNVNNFATINATGGTIGGVVANQENSGGDINNCVNYGNVTSNSYIVGGIVGSGGKNILNSVNYGAVTAGSEIVGGISGTTKAAGSISKCVNYGAVMTTSNDKGNTGGIVGKCLKPISNCKNYGLVNCTRDNVGGIVGNTNQNVTNCENYGKIDGGWTVGGVIGYTTAAVSDCKNDADVTGATTHIGGIVGSSELTITNCTNNGNVLFASWGGGGIAGNCSGNITSCINNGNVNGTGQLGGIVGKLASATAEISNCVNNGDVTGTSNHLIGGIVGNVTVAGYTEELKTILTTTNTNTGTCTGASIYGTIQA